MWLVCECDWVSEWASVRVSVCACGVCMCVWVISSHYWRSGKWTGTWVCLCLYECIPVIDAVPRRVEFVHDLFDLACVVSGIFLQKLIGEFIKGRQALLSSTELLQERLTTTKNQYIKLPSKQHNKSSTKRVEKYRSQMLFGSCVSVPAESNFTSEDFRKSVSTTFYHQPF